MTPPEEVNAGLTAVGFMPGQAQAVTGLIGMLRTAIAGLSDFVHEQFAVVQADLNQLRGSIEGAQKTHNEVQITSQQNRTEMQNAEAKIRALQAVQATCP